MLYNITTVLIKLRILKLSKLKVTRGNSGHVFFSGHL